jgi:formylglycine-generating enzyme required for sulfatase activity
VGRSEVTRRIAACAAVVVFFLLLAGCPLDLRSYVEWLKTRDALIPIEEILITSAGDSYQMGDGFIGPNPTRRQYLTYDFVMSKYEITNAQFKVFMDQGGYTTQGYWTNAGWSWLQMNVATVSNRPDMWLDSLFNSPAQPVVGVSWHEAVAYCNWRSEQEGLVVAYDRSTGAIIATADGYRLPTLVEREYAAAKGDSSSSERLYPWGDEVPYSLTAVFSTTATMAVGSKSPAGDTPQGLADMSGNAVEWCSDNAWLPLEGAVDAYYFFDAGGATSIIMRGGAYGSVASDELRNANNMTMATATPGERLPWFGFRTVRRQ